MKSSFLVVIMLLMSLIFLPGCENDHKEHAIHAIAINPSYSQTINDITLEIKCLSKAEKKSFFKDNQRLLNAVLDGSIVPLQVSIANESNVRCTIKPKNTALSLLSKNTLLNTIKSVTKVAKSTGIASAIGFVIGSGLSARLFFHRARSMAVVAVFSSSFIFCMLVGFTVGIGLAVRSGIINRALKKALSKHPIFDRSVHIDAISSYKGIMFVKKADYRDSFKMTFDSKNGKQKIAFDVVLS